MEVVRDSLWERCLADAVKMYRLSEPNEKCYSLANATWVMKKKYREHQEKKEETIDFLSVRPFLLFLPGFLAS